MRYKLQEIANVAAGQGAPQGDHNYCDYGIPFVKAGNLAELIAGADIGSIQKVNEEVAKKHRLKLFRKGSVLFAKSGMSCLKGFVYVLPSDAYVVSHLACVTPEKVNSEYLKYYFLFHKPNTLIKDEAYPSISLTDIANMVVQVPENNVVRNVVSTLEKVESLLALYKSQLQKLDELVKSQFIEMFGVPGTDPYGWGLTTLGKCCELNPRKPKDINTEALYSFVAMPSVSEDGRIDVSVEKPYAEICKGFTYFAENDVLFAKITPCMENGKGGVAVGLKNSSGFGSTEFHVLRPIKGISDPYWLYIITMFRKFRSDAEKVMTGTGGQRRVPISYLNEVKIALPPIALQEQFAAFVRQIDKSKFAVRQALDKTQQLFDSLMQEYFG